ncbi:MAG: hypothetical protein ACFCUJ_12930 [Thiotrichales bacterium]
MSKHDLATSAWYDPIIGFGLRLAAGGLIPARWFQSCLPKRDQRAAKHGQLQLELVSHCWNYAHLLVYQLSSLVKFPPRKTSVTMTVYYCDEDTGTVALLNYFSQLSVPNVKWNWRNIPRTSLFRRAIGRNHAALGTSADWIWFTDCDLMFRDACIDSLAERLQGSQHALHYPKHERTTSLLSDADPLLLFNSDDIKIVDIDDSRFIEHLRTRATGPLQITHGDVARACGYCNALTYYQKPSETWCKAREDRAFRWLLGTQGIPLSVPGVYRIRHASKGRYTGNRLSNALRSHLRHTTAKFKEPAK